MPPRSLSSKQYMMAQNSICPAEAALLIHYGKWTDAEVAYTNYLITAFDKGILKDCPPLQSLRSYLAKYLQCTPMRVSKKFKERSIGKEFFSPNYENGDLDTEWLDILRIRFISSIESHLWKPSDPISKRKYTSTINEPTGLLHCENVRRKYLFGHDPRDSPTSVADERFISEASRDKQSETKKMLSVPAHWNSKRACSPQFITEEYFSDEQVLSADDSVIVYQHVIILKRNMSAEIDVNDAHHSDSGESNGEHSSDLDVETDVFLPLSFQHISEGSKNNEFLDTELLDVLEDISQTPKRK